MDKVYTKDTIDVVGRNLKGVANTLDAFENVGEINGETLAMLSSVIRSQVAKLQVLTE